MNAAVAQMDRVTQGNAATAEETASASSELSAQSGNLNQMVADLGRIVGGKNDNRATAPTNGKTALAAPPRHRLSEFPARGAEREERFSMVYGNPEEDGVVEGEK